MTKDSDIDLLVIEPAPGNTRAEGLRIYESLGLGYPLDVFVMDSERFEESKNIFGGLAFPAQKYGRTIYEAA
jgi:predicted nucleotidyltransferase